MKSTNSQAPVLEPLSESEQWTPNPEPPKRSWLWALFSILMLTVGGVGLWRWVAIAEGTAQVQKPERTSRARPVIAIPLEVGRGVQRVELLGQVEAGESATIRSQTSGVVQQIGVSEGDRVNTGDIIAILGFPRPAADPIPNPGPAGPSPKSTGGTGTGHSTGSDPLSWRQPCSPPKLRKCKP